MIKSWTGQKGFGDAELLQGSDDSEEETEGLPQEPNNSGHSPEQYELQNEFQIFIGTTFTCLFPSSALVFTFF